MDEYEVDISDNDFNNDSWDSFGYPEDVAIKNMNDFLELYEHLLSDDEIDYIHYLLDDALFSLQRRRQRRRQQR